MPTYSLYGPDRYTMQQQTERLLEQYLPAAEGMRALALARLDCAKVGSEEVVQAVQALPFLGGWRVTILDGLFARFGRLKAEGEEDEAPAPEQPKKGRKSKDAPLDALDTIGAALISLPESSVVILRDTIMPKKDGRQTVLKLPGNHRLTRYLKGATEVQCSAPQGIQLLRWIEQRVKAAGATINEEAARLLAEGMDEESDLSRLALEIEKLAIYTGPGGRIDPLTVRLLTSSSIQDDVFKLVNAMAAKNSGDALRQLALLLEGGTHPFQLLSTIAWQFRNLLLVKELAQQKLGQDAIAGKLGMNPFVVRRSLEQVHAFSLDQLRAIHRRLLDFDVAAKSSMIEPELGLELLVTEVCRPTPTPSRR